MAQGAERRRFPRVKAKVPVELYSDATTACARAATEEISLGGCYIETMFTMQVGTKLQVKLWVKGEQLNLSALVVTCYPQVGNGIEFVEMAPGDRSKLASFIAACAQENG